MTEKQYKQKRATLRQRLSKAEENDRLVDMQSFEEQLDNLEAMYFTDDYSSQCVC